MSGRRCAAGRNVVDRIGSGLEDDRLQAAGE